MHQRAVIASVALFVLIIVGMFTFAFLKQREIAPVTPDADTPATPQTPAVTRVDAKHFYIDGVHTLVGEIAMPTPCDLLEATAVVAESMPEQITVNFNVVNTAEFCAQVITPQRFKVSAPASADTTWSATFMGQPIILNLIPATSGETPDDFELFIKG